MAMLFLELIETSKPVESSHDFDNFGGLIALFVASFASVVQKRRIDMLELAIAPQGKRRYRWIIFL